MSTRNLTLEWRQRKVTNKINNIYIEYLMISRKVKKFVPITWADVKPGYILRVKSGQEFPADCLILDIQGAAG
jgi:magnesium-transporting ATPase (P-type)